MTIWQQVVFPRKLVVTAQWLVREEDPVRGHSKQKKKAHCHLSIGTAASPNMLMKVSTGISNPCM